MIICVCTIGIHQSVVKEVYYASLAGSSSLQQDRTKWIDYVSSLPFLVNWLLLLRGSISAVNPSCDLSLTKLGRALSGMYEEVLKRLNHSRMVLSVRI